MSAKHYLLYGSERYALAILRPLQAAIRARGDEAAWFFDGPGGEELQPGRDACCARPTRGARVRTASPCSLPATPCRTSFRA